MVQRPEVRTRWPTPCSMPCGQTASGSSPAERCRSWCHPAMTRSPTPHRRSSDPDALATRRLHLVDLDGGHVLAVAVERALRLREHPHVLPVLHLRQHETAADLVPADVGGPEHPLAADG